MFVVVMKTTHMSALAALLTATPTTFAASYQIDVHISSGPNQNGWYSRHDYAVFAGYARDAMMQGVTELGPDPKVDPTGYREFASGQVIDTGYAVATRIKSWQGKANPTGAFANQNGNRLKYSLHLQTTGGAKFTLADVSWTNIATKNGALLGDGSNTSGTLQFNTSTAYDGLYRYGLDWGDDGIKGTSDDIIYNNGETGNTLVNELYYVGLGRAWTEDHKTPGLTDQERIDATRNYLDGAINEATFTINGESGSGYVKFSAVPEPSSAALLGLGGLALILRRRK